MADDALDELGRLTAEILFRTVVGAIVIVLAAFAVWSMMALIGWMNSTFGDGVGGLAFAFLLVAFALGTYLVPEAPS